MAGIYIHVPFCRKACNYCNFHFSTSLKSKRKLVDAILTEISIKENSGFDDPLQSIYFGGGTPSLLSAEELGQILKALANYYNWTTATEITLEANPEDINPRYLESLLQLGVNRLSVGVQSFREEDLLHMNRAHDVADSLRCIREIKEAGFDNYTIDLMFGLINSTTEFWRQKERDGKLKQGTEDLQKEQYHLAEELLKSAGYDHYEVSNYALTNYKAIHNSNYWTRQAYEGYGPSAHSYYDRKRSWNIANNAQYIRKLEERVLPAESEQLEDGDFYNELIMLGLRTAKGISKKSLEDLPDIIQLYWEEEVSKYLNLVYQRSCVGRFILHSRRLKQTISLHRRTIKPSNDAAIRNRKYYCDDIATVLRKRGFGFEQISKERNRL